ncbi:MAG: PP2C family protein-serine/threonine phosphatase [Vicinamibacterales bacterium]
MRLRTRLAVAFFFMSVLPVAAITLYSYFASLEAFRRASRAEAEMLAAQMAQRMEYVTNDLQRRVDRAWSMPEQIYAAEQAAQGKEKADQVNAGAHLVVEQQPELVRARLATVLGEAAGLVERIEFLPAGLAPDAAKELRAAAAGVDAPTTPPTHPVAGVPKTSAAQHLDAVPPSGPPSPRRPLTRTAPPLTPPEPPKPQRIVVDLAELEKLGAEIPFLRNLTAEQMAGVSNMLARQVEMGLRIAEREIARRNAEGATALEGAASPGVQGVHPGVGARGAQPRDLSVQSGDRTGRSQGDDRVHPPAPGGVRSHTWVMTQKRTPAEVGFAVGRGETVVGTVRTHFAMDRMLGAVMSLTRSDQGDIPFAIDSERRIYTPRKTDAKRLDEMNIAERAIASTATPAIGSAGAGTARAAGAPGAAAPDAARVPSADSASISATDDEWIIATQKDDSGVVFGIARPIGPALYEIRRTAASNLVLGIGVMSLAFIGIVPLSRRMTRNLSVLTDGVREIAQGNLDVRVPVRSHDEIGQLATAVNQMAKDLQAHQKLLVQQERLKRELELCRQIQNDMLPHDTLRAGLAEVRGVSIPAREVGGDFFNYFVLPSGELALLVGDVAGKGVGAALLMANIQATLRARLPLESDLPALVASVDREIEQSTPRGVYVTLFIGIFDAANRTLRYVNAGHNPQFVLRAGGAIDRMPSTGLPVGMFAGHGYEQRSVSLSHGDQLFFYTDGAVEVENEKGDMFGSERLEALLVAGLKDGRADLLADVEEAIRGFKGSAELFDDATMMVLRMGEARAAA